MEVRSIGIISKPRKEEIRQIIPELLDWMAARKIRALIDDVTASDLGPELTASLKVSVFPRSELPAKSDLLLVLGHDAGTGRRFAG